LLVEVLVAVLVLTVGVVVRVGLEQGQDFLLPLELHTRLLLVLAALLRLLAQLEMLVPIPLLRAHL
jgi:hypothetical protein